MKTAIQVQNEASLRFNPLYFKDYLIRTPNGDIIVDRSKILHTKDDRRLFGVILGKDYGWDYHNFDTTTIYFEEINNRIIGGCYDINIGKKSQCLIAVSRLIAKEYDYSVYSYTPDTLKSIIECIQNA